MEDEQLLIMTVSLESPKRFMAFAVFNGSSLAITHCKPITGPPSVWRDDLIETIQDRVKRGFVVLVEDRTNTIARYGTKYLFDDMEEGRSNLYHALDWYFSMQALGSIVSEPDVERFMVRSGQEGAMVEQTQDEKGRVTYSVNWTAFTGGHKAVLMCVVAAMLEPASERFVRAMYGTRLEQESKEFDPIRAFKTITVEHDRNRFEEFERKVIDRG